MRMPQPFAGVGSEALPQEKAKGVAQEEPCNLNPHLNSQMVDQGAIGICRRCIAVRATVFVLTEKGPLTIVPAAC